MDWSFQMQGWCSPLILPQKCLTAPQYQICRGTNHLLADHLVPVIRHNYNIHCNDYEWPENKSSCIPWNCQYSRNPGANTPMYRCVSASVLSSWTVMCSAKNVLIIVIGIVYHRRKIPRQGMNRSPTHPLYHVQD